MPLKEPLWIPFKEPLTCIPKPYRIVGYDPLIIVEARKLEHGFRRIRAGIPLYFTLRGIRENDVPTFWLLL